jgi:hypothetical protein
MAEKEKGFERLNATVQWTVAADGSTEANLYFDSIWNQNANKSLLLLKFKRKTPPKRVVFFMAEKEKGFERTARPKGGQKSVRWTVF